MTEPSGNLSVRSIVSRRWRRSEGEAVGSRTSSGAGRRLRQPPQLEALEHVGHALDAVAREGPHVAERQLLGVPGAAQSQSEAAVHDETPGARVRLP